MINPKSLVAMLALVVVPVALGVEPKEGAIRGTVTKMDRAAKTAAVKTADGTEHVVHFVGRTAVHGAEKTAAGADDVFHGVKEGSEVVVHYTAKGAEVTAEEVDHVGEDGLHVTEGTVSHLDRGTKVVVVKTKDGTEETFRMTDRAAKDIGKGAEKSGKVTVYYTEEGGRKVAHFFEKAL